MTQTSHATPLPLPINIAMSRVTARIMDILAQHSSVYATRRDYAGNVARLLTVALRHTSIQHDGAWVSLIPNSRMCRQLTLPQVARESGLSLATVERIVAELGRLGWMEQGRQALRTINGCLSVTGVLRRLTAKFWALLGLGSAFAHACNKAIKKLTLMTPRYLLQHVRLRGAKSAPPTQPTNSALYAKAVRCPRFTNDCNHCSGGHMPPEVCAGASVICAGLQAVGR